MKSIIEYKWIGGNQELRSKTKVVDVSNNNSKLIINYYFDDN